MKSHLYIIGFLVTLFIHFIYAANENDNDSKEQRYLIFIKNDYGEYKIYSNNDGHQKRETSQVYVESMMDKINKLIIKNMDTYENPDELEKIKETAEIGKETTNDSQSVNLDSLSGDYIYPISSVDDRVVLYTYLSEELVDKIQSMDGVISCLPDKKTFSLNSYYNTEDILKETQWKNVSVQENAPGHLSLLSQGKYNPEFISEYDNNYYYPSSAGQDIDIVILDSRFRFNYSEFSNTDERIVKCVAEVEDGKSTVADSDSICGGTLDEHGQMVSDVVGGIVNGVAKRANIYGVTIYTDDDGLINDSDILCGLQYIYENLIRSRKTVINLSLGGFYYNSDDDYYYQLKSIIHNIYEKGGIMVAAAGNDSQFIGKNTKYRIPCEFNDVICVGGFENNIHISSDTSYGVFKNSNYGPAVDVYAPYYVQYTIWNVKRTKKGMTSGTSFSSSLVAGLIATIMSENPDVEYTKETVLQQLKKNGKSEIISYYIGNGIMANNGKHIVYSEDGQYHGCGIYAGNQACDVGEIPSYNEIPNIIVEVSQNGMCGPNNSFTTCGNSKCCSSDGYCGDDSTSCGNNCISGFGKCDNDRKPEGRCGPGIGSCSNPKECCDAFGYCGVSSDFCGEGCQSEFGQCNYTSTTTEKRTTTTTTSTTTITINIESTTTNEPTSTTKKTTTTTKKSTPTSNYITVKFKGTMQSSKYYLGVNDLKAQSSFDIYKLESSSSAIYRTWHITSKSSPSLYYLSNATYGNDGKPSSYCLDLGRYVNGEGYAFLSIVSCSKAQHKFKYGGTHTKTIDIYDLNNKHMTDNKGHDLCLYYSMSPRISRCDYIDKKSNKNAEHMAWDVFYL